MARTTKIIAALLALISCAPGGVAALAACRHVAGDTPFVARDPHACCRARGAHAFAHRQAALSRTAATDYAARAEPGGDAGTNAACCCAGQAARTRVPTVSAARKQSRDADTPARRAAPLSTPNDPHPPALAPKQHAPPRAPARLHILHGSILI
jgi:hypothetical protein